MVLVLAGGWFLGVQPQIAAAATSAGSTMSVQTQNQSTRIKLAELAKAAAKTSAMETENAVLLKAVPSILKPNTFIRRINEVAALDGVRVASVSSSDSVVYTPPASVANPAAAAADGTASVPLAQADPSITATNFTAVPVTVAVTGTAAAVVQFSHDIQNDERVFAINNIQTTTDDTGLVAATFAGYIYTLKR